MEQARYWMWSRRKQSLSSHLQASSTNPLYGDSWEEQAFAEDAAGPLGGCTWPPRSYSCSFCSREFRSAQALGGHMNVHRRDRARLKQSPPSPHDHEVQVLHHHNPILNHQYPSQICTMVYNPNPNSDRVVFASPSSSCRVSHAPTQELSNEKTFIPLFSSPILEEHHKKPSIYSPPSWSNQYFHMTDLNNEEKNSKFIGSNSRGMEDCVAEDLSVSLNLVVRRTRPTSSGGQAEAIGCKRRRIDSTPLLSFPKSNSGDRQHVLPSEALERSSGSVEELDLELRLGDRPEVK
ncbi:unnamed protein product [Camellia sinensis]